MKKVIGFTLFALVLTACAPAAGRPAIRMIGTPQDMVNAAVEVCPTIAPSGYNFLSIDAVGDNFVSCRAQVTTGFAILGALGRTASSDQKLTASFTSVSDDVVQVAISSFPRNSDIEDRLEIALRSLFSLTPTQ